MKVSKAIEYIMQERDKQIEKGFSPEHDDQHVVGELAAAGGSYALAVYQDQSGIDYDKPPYDWPFEVYFWKSDASELEKLTIAGAFIVAEMERIMRRDGISE